MLKKLRYLVFVVVVLLLAACGTGSSEDVNENNASEGEASAGTAEESITLSYAFFSPAETYPGVVAQMWADELKERTDGQVETEIYFGGTLLDASNMFDGVAQGTADIGLMALSYEPGKFPLVEIAEISRGFSTAESAGQVMHKLIEEYPPEALADFEIIKVFTTDAMPIMSIEPIASLDDLKGKQIRIGGALTPVLERLGGTPVGMSQAESAQALQTGVIDGTVGDRETLKSVRFAELVNHYTDYPLAVTTLVAVMNKDAYAALPDNVKEVIQELKEEMPVVAGQYLDTKTEEAVQWAIDEEGLEVVSLEPGEKEKWDEIITELQDEYVQSAAEQGLPAEEFRDRVYELIEQYSNN